MLAFVGLGVRAHHPGRAGGCCGPVDREAGVGPSPGEQLPELALRQLMQHVLLAESGDTPRAP